MVTPESSRKVDEGGVPSTSVIPKVHEILHEDFFDFSGIRSQFADLDACFFCLGVSSVGMSASEYRHVTYDLTLAAATAIASVTSRHVGRAMIEVAANGYSKQILRSDDINRLAASPRPG